MSASGRNADIAGPCGATLAASSPPLCPTRHQGTAQPSSVGLTYARAITKSYLSDTELIGIAMDGRATETVTQSGLPTLLLR